MQTLTHEQARQFYDRFGARQDNQRWYEDRPIAALLDQLDFSGAERLLEFGVGTGRLAEKLLHHELPSSCHYVGIDASATMIALADDRLEPWFDRVRLIQSDGTIQLDLDDGSRDHIISTYVLDLLSEEDIRQFLREAHRVLTPTGRCGLVGLTWGEEPISRGVMGVWSAVHSLSPRLVGGCRPLRLEELLDPNEWTLVDRRVVTCWGLASEAVVLSPR
ncbi:hypothetical protein Pan216_12070 [Planctomycetes bacterium Pan216]|uniref:Methyltransferase domain-containing protein n=1 Tax=Kolteria novifilia TaxID=2527975 RepID=A0A518B063_9BACT|nr:hypothetical protein Pan216_12070 [Planctomycetes bacterium Pan216]